MASGLLGGSQGVVECWSGGRVGYDVFADDLGAV